MNTAVIVISVITLAAVIATLYVTLRGKTKPRVKVYFSDGSTHAAYRCNDEVSVSFHIENIGSWPGLPKTAAREIALLVYMPPKFELKKITWGSQSNSKVLNAPADGIFRGMHYIATGAFALFHREVEVVTVDVKTPDEIGRYNIFVPILSKEGDLGVKKLQISVI